MKTVISLISSLMYLLTKPEVWIVPVLLLIIGYFGIIRKLGLKKSKAILPVISEHYLTGILFENKRAFWRAFIFALIFFSAAVYLDSSRLGAINFGHIYFIVALCAYGFYMIRFYWRLGKAFGRSIFFRLGMILLPPLFLNILGWSKIKFEQGPAFRVHLIPGKLFSFLKEAFYSLLLLGEIAVVGIGVMALSFVMLKPRIIISMFLDEVYDNTKDVAADGGVISREDEMTAEEIASMPVGREKFFPSHANDQNAVVMVYLIGADLENKAGMATANIRQMIDASKKGENLTFVVEAGGSIRWFTDGIDDKSHAIYTIQNGSLKKVKDLDATQTMSAGSQLKDFIVWTKENVPADRYMLVLWDHGGGLGGGYGQDYYNPGREYHGGVISTSSVVNAVKDSGVTFDMIGFDACLMQDIEIAYALEPYADYYVASEETEGGLGWDYAPSFGMLAENPAIPTEEFCRSLVAVYDPYNRAVNEGKAQPGSTLSVVDLSMIRPAYEKLNELYAREHHAILDSPARFADISAAISNSYTFANDEQADLIDYLNTLEKIDIYHRIMTAEEYSSVKKAVQASVLYRNKDAYENIYGMAFTFPYKSVDGYTSVYEQYKSFSMTTAEDFYSDYFSIIASHQEPSTSPLASLFPHTDLRSEEWYRKGFEEYGDYNLPQQGIALVEKPGGYQADLPDSAWDIIVDTKQIKYRQTEEGLQYLGTDYLGNLDENGRLLVTPSQNWVHINDMPVCYEAAAPRQAQAGTLHTGTVKALLNGTQEVIIHIEWSAVRPETEGHPVGRIIGYHNADNEDAYMAKGLDQFQTGDTLQFIFSFFDENGKLLSTKPYGKKYRIFKANGLKVTDAPMEGSLKQGLIMQDMYQRTLVTDLIDVPADTQQ